MDAVRTVALPTIGRPARDRASVASSDDSPMPVRDDEELELEPALTAPGAGAGRAEPRSVDPLLILLGVLNSGPPLLRDDALPELEDEDPDDDDPLEPDDEPPPDEPEDPLDVAPPLATACASAMTGTASPIATTTDVSARIDLVMSGSRGPRDL